ncbi:uncharacterized acetyltransferase At3g50280-like [Chenopodium quinoa]|uniref:uncharacterized acetyltransferase At3g50280-like n=1 Tax=Chenopodium quinoa TaxID=63459 RepID=UPI000B788191|nr:uncharacterized acetyltransferase At3g50280-like [Chenopodium quinoa]
MWKVSKNEGVFMESYVMERHGDFGDYDGPSTQMTEKDDSYMDLRHCHGRQGVCEDLWVSIFCIHFDINCLLLLPFFGYRFNPPPFEERFFHFSSETIAKLKARANQEISSNNTAISSFQALAAFLWKSIIQAKGLKPDQQTHCKLAANNRTRLNPPLPEEYFGNSLIILTSTTTVGELFKHNLGWTASLVQQSVVDLTNKTVNDFADSWFKSPFVIRLDQMIEKDEGNSVQVGSSPRFNIYGNEFAGLGKPIAVRSGYANKYDGKITVYPGFEGRGSVDAEISLSSAYMRALESNKEFMAVVSSP